MLSRLLSLLEQSEGQVDLLRLSRELGADPGAVAGMLETLRRMGRLDVPAPACGVCESCSLSKQCRLPARRVRQYRRAP
jgi:hypothetical protein